MQRISLGGRPQLLGTQAAAGEGCLGGLLSVEAEYLKHACIDARRHAHT